VIKRLTSIESSRKALQIRAAQPGKQQTPNFRPTGESSMSTTIFAAGTQGPDAGRKVVELVHRVGKGDHAVIAALLGLPKDAAIKAGTGT
jgi:hypothetical protein